MSQFLLATPPDFRFRATVWSHGWCMLPPFSNDDETGILSRVQKLRDGQIVRFGVRAAEPALLISSESDLTREHEREIGAVVARCLSFDHDLSSFHALIRQHETYLWIEAAGAGRMLCSPTVWEDLAKTLLTTNTTWAMTIAMVTRLVTLGDAALDGSHVFPTPEQIAGMQPDALNAHVRAGYRGAYLHELATRIADGSLDVEAMRDPALSSADVYKALKRIKGFGDYAAGAMMRLLGRFDQLGLDSVCRAMYAQRYNAGNAASDREIAAYYAPFGIWKGLVVWLDVMSEQLRAT